MNGNGISEAFRVCSDLFTTAAELDHEELENLCKISLSLSNNPEIFERHNNSKKSSQKSTEKKLFDLIPNLDTSSQDQIQNKSLRFGIKEPTKRNFLSRTLTASSSSSSTGSQDYEDVTLPEILNSSISEICIIQKGDPIPNGYYRLSKTPTNKKANLNAHSGGNPIFLCIKKDLTGNATPVTSIVVIYPDKNEFVPPGYFVVKKRNHACNLNTGTSLERIFLCYKKDKIGNPINDIVVIMPGNKEEDIVPKSFNLIETSPTGIPANINTGSSSHKIFVCYHQILLRLKCLANEKSSNSPRKDLDLSTSQSNVKTGLMRKSSSLNVLIKSTDATDNLIDRSGTIPVISARSHKSDGASVSCSTSVEDLSPACPLSGIASEDIIDDLIAEIDKSQLLLEKDELMESNELIDESIYTTVRSCMVVTASQGTTLPREQRACLHTILTALYIRQSELAMKTLASLSSLLKDTDFFSDDLQGVPMYVGSLAMLDITVEAVCDRFDFCIERESDHILSFLKILIKHSGGRLSSLSLQRIFRTLSFQCAYYSTRHYWFTNGYSVPYSDQGTELSCFRTLKELIWALVAQVETVDVAHMLPDGYKDNFDYSNQKESFIVARMIVVDLTEDVIDSVEVNRLSEMANMAITKQLATSSYFWKQLVTLSKVLFKEPQQRGAFVALCSLCKLAGNVTRTTEVSSTTPRDFGSKLLALETILEFCSVSGEKMRHSKVMGYQIRRLVVPCVLSNIPLSFYEHRLFSKLLKIISALWKNWRTHIRIEFANIVEQFIIPVLQASTLKIRPILQSIVLQEVVTWFDQPHLIIEMFVNFDMDGKFVSHWNIFSHLVLSMCVIARRAALVTGAWDWKQPVLSQATTVADTLILRNQVTVMDATGHAFLGIEGPNGGRWKQNSNLIKSADSSSSIASREEDDDCSFGVRYRRAIHEEAEEYIKQAIKIYQEKVSLKKAVQYLISKDFMADSPQEIASFLRVYKNSFDASAIGEYLGEGGVTPEEEVYWSMIRFRYTRAVCFVEMDIVVALRMYLTGCGFRLPGEAQKIDRFVEVFQKAYWQDNHGTPYCPFKTPDTVHLLSYAIIMLNTDLHRANVDDKKHNNKKRKKMTKEEFISNLRGCDQGSNIDRGYLSMIYDNIAASPIELAVELSEVHLSGEHPAASSSSSLRSSASETNSLTDEKQFQKDITRTIRDSEDLLRSLSPFTYSFQLASIDTHISMDLVSFMFETVWHHFHAISESVLSDLSFDLHITLPALDILYYSLSSSMLLNAKTEQRAFAAQLKKFQSICRNAHKSSEFLEDDSWFTKLEKQTAETVIEYISDIHRLFVRLKDSIQQSTTYEITRNMASKLEKKTKVLENNIFFVRDGDLSKRNRSGRLDRYHFFLFSNYLYYCHQAMNGEYKAHEQLELSEMNISDIDEPTNCSFYITHPTKSFVVVAESVNAKNLWIKDINQTIVSFQKRRESAFENGRGRKLSMVERIETQQSNQKKEADKRHSFLSSASFRRKSRSPIVLDDNHKAVPITNLKLNSPKLNSSLHDSKTPGVKLDGISEEDSHLHSLKIASPKSAPLSGEDRAAYLRASREGFNELVSTLDHEGLTSLFVAGVNFWNGMLESRSSKNEDPVMVQMYALQHLIKNGPYQSTDTAENFNNNSLSIPYSKSGKLNGQSVPELIEAWKSFGKISEADAKRSFLKLLVSVAPYWKYNQFL